jgi:hypothetical protein
VALKLSFFIEAIDRATAPLRAINRMIESTTGPISRVTRSWGNLTGQVRGVATNLTLMTGAVAGAFYPLHRMIDEGSKIHDTAANLGITTREFQRLAYAINQDGGSLDDARNAVLAANGNEEMVKWFERAGMSPAFLRANLEKTDVLLKRFADGMEALPKKGGYRLSVSLATLGRGSDKVVQALSRGARGLNELGDEAESLGIILSDEVLKKMDDAGDSMHKVWRVLRSLTALIAVAAIPLIGKVVTAIIEWAHANRGLIKTRATEFFERLSESLPKIVGAAVQITAALGVVAGVINTLAGLMGGWENVIIALAGVVALKLTYSIVALGVALLGVIPAIGAISAALLTSGIVLGIAAIAGLAYVIYRNWEPISKFFTDLWEGVKSAFGSAVQWISEKIALLTGLVTNAVVKLNDLMPSWVKSGTLPGIALNAVAGAIGPAGGGKTNLGGTLKIEIDQKGRASVTELKSDSNALDFEVYLGNMVVP